MEGEVETGRRSENCGEKAAAQEVKNYSEQCYLG